MADLPSLVDLVFVGNPLEEKYAAEGNWIEEATKRLPKLKKLDGKCHICDDMKKKKKHHMLIRQWLQKMDSSSFSFLGNPVIKQEEEEAEGES